MKCKQMDIICSVFSELSHKQSIIAIDILRSLYNKRKYGMNIVELNSYFKNRYIHLVYNTISQLKKMGYIKQLNNSGIGIRYIITPIGIEKHWQICSTLKSIIGLTFPA